jgi:flagella basal body P-ring formation protein FlgA
MTSFASAGLLIALVAGAPAAPPDSASVDPLFEVRVAECVAREWNVPPESVHLGWSDPASASASPSERIRLIGRGSDGWFAVAIDPDGPGAAALRVRAGVDDTVLVATRPLNLGSTIRDGDLRAEKQLHWGPPSRRVDERPATGWEVRRPLATGEIVGWPAVVAPSVILSGQPVRMEWSRGGVRVLIEGIALNAARVGEIVRVRANGRREPIAGQATAPGTAVLCGGGTR